MKKKIRVIFLVLGLIVLGTGLFAAQSQSGPFHPPERGKVGVSTDSLVIQTALGFQARFLDSWTRPIGIGVSSNGDTIYFTDLSNDIFRDRSHTIKSFPTPGSGLFACRLRGALYVGDGNGDIWKLDQGQVTPRGHDPNGYPVSAIDVDTATGTVYFLTQYLGGLMNYLYKLPPNVTTGVLIKSWPDLPGWGLAVKGNWLYVSDYHGNSISRISKNGGSFFLVSTGLSGPMDIGFDKLGNLFVAEWFGGSIARIKAGGGNIVRIATGFLEPFYLQLDGSGNIYLTDFGAGEIWKLSK